MNEYGRDCRMCGGFERIILELFSCSVTCGDCARTNCVFSRKMPDDEGKILLVGQAET